jgi:hypothetical protein
VAIESKGAAIIATTPARKQIADTAPFDPGTFKPVLRQQIVQQCYRAALVWRDRGTFNQVCG